MDERRILGNERNRRISKKRKDIFNKCNKNTKINYGIL